MTLTALTEFLREIPEIISLNNILVMNDKNREALP